MESAKVCKWLLVCIVAIDFCCFVRGEVTQNDDGSGTISFKPPTLNDEEAHSMHMPPEMKCDSCTAIAYQFGEAFKAAHARRKSLPRLPESDLIKIMEETCDGGNLEKYGVKEVKGVKRLSGPGLEAEDTPGIMQGGGKWPDRMKRMCNLYVEEYDEIVIYEEYMENEKGLHKFLCKSDTYKGLTDVCSPKKDSKPKAKKQSKKKGKKEEL